MIDVKFGDWTVVRRIENYKTNINYECRCSCGNISNIRRTYLINKRTTSCKRCSGNSFNDLTGRRFGRTLVIGIKLRKNSRGHLLKFFVGRCDCGKTRIVSGNDLLRGNGDQCKSCSNKTHGMSNTSTYLIYKAMINRCYSKKNQAYRNYGGRGIKVCSRWRNSFENFLEDMGEHPKNLQIDRRDPDGNYEPKNCHWVTPSENQANRRISKKNRDNYIMIKLSGYKLIDGNYILIK